MLKKKIKKRRRKEKEHIIRDKIYRRPVDSVRTVTDDARTDSDLTHWT